MNKSGNLEKEKGSVGLKLIPSKKSKNDTLKSKSRSTASIVNDNASTSSNETRTAGKAVGDNIAGQKKSSNSLIGKIEKCIPNKKINKKIKLPKEVLRTSHAMYLYPSKLSSNAFSSMQQIEELFKKYFFKSNLDVAFIIANILNVLSLSEKHYKLKCGDELEEATKAEKKRERYLNDKIYSYHKKVLRTKLTTYFNLVVNCFTNEDIKLAFTMFFVIIISILRTVEMQRFNTSTFFIHTALLLKNNLEYIKLENPGISLMLNIDILRTDCINLIKLLETTLEKDPLLPERLPVFFVCSVSRKYCFSEVIHAIVGDITEQLELLLENAADQLRSYSAFDVPQNITSPENTTNN